MHAKLLLCFAWVNLFVLSGCSLVPDVRHKPQLINPFPQIRSVAVLPFINQSQEPTLSGERVALAYMNELQAIRGFEVLPLGAVKAKLSEVNRPLSSGEDFQQFAAALGVDVVLVGSVTDYDAYYPPRMSLKVSWYAANPGFHPILPGYGLPWGTSEEKKIPRWVHHESQRALATEQLKTQTPQFPEALPIMPEDRRELQFPTSRESQSGSVSQASSQLVLDAPTTAYGNEQLAHDGYGHTDFGSDRMDHNDIAAALPPDWPDPRGFVPDPPMAMRPPMLAQHEPIISHMRNFNGHDEDFTEQLADYFYYRDDARHGGWQAYLQRSEDFIRFCCYLHLSETLILRGGQDESRLILRWPIDRYTR
ncbi:MAG: hypothetical protein R3C53_03060 [Pirellulaceae bacterium]